MKKITFLLAVLFYTVQFSFAQSPTLVEDYILGPQGSADGRIYNFQDVLTYEGTSQIGEKVILQYNKLTDEIIVKATENDFDGRILRISSNNEEMAIFTGEGTDTKQIYKTFESDFSDIQKIYDSGDAQIKRIRFYEGHTLIIEDVVDLNETTTNIKIIDPDNTINELYSGLPGNSFDFIYTAINGHFIIAPELELIDGKGTIAYNLDMKSIVPITDIIPEYEECGLLSKLSSALESIIIYECDKTYVYDLNTGLYIDYEDDFFFIVHNTEDHVYIVNNAKLERVDKATAEVEVIMENIITSRGFFSDFVFLSINNNLVDITYYDFEEDKSYTYPTSYPVGPSYRLTSFDIVPSGLHFILYQFQDDNGVITKINSESFTEIDSVFNVSFNNRPVAYDEDIYFVHQDPIVGNELFVIDYAVNSVIDNNILSSIKISPNPAQAFINIEHAIDLIPLTTSIFDSNGSFVLKQVQGNKIDIRSLTSGIYTLRTSYDNGKLGIERFVVK